MKDDKDLKGLEDLGKEEVFDREEATIRVPSSNRQGMVAIKLKKSEPKSKEKKLPDHIRKAYITINDKRKGDPISIVFEGDWVPSDINLAGRFLILDFHKFVRDRAMRGK